MATQKNHTRGKKPYLILPSGREYMWFAATRMVEPMMNETEYTFAFVKPNGVVDNAPARITDMGHLFMEVLAFRHGLPSDIRVRASIVYPSEMNRRGEYDRIHIFVRQAGLAEEPFFRDIELDERDFDGVREAEETA